MAEPVTTKTTEPPSEPTTQVQPAEVNTSQIHKLRVFLKRRHLIFPLMSKKATHFSTSTLLFLRLLRSGYDNALFMHDFIWILLCI